MSSDDVTFLKEQVERLNAVLEIYQQKYPPESLSSEDPLNAPPWLTDKSVMIPLLVEYDSNIKELERQIEYYKQELNMLRQQMDKVLNENSRLSKELKDMIESQLGMFDGVGTGRPGSGDDQLLQNLQKQLQNAIKEKESAVEMWQTSVAEIERLQQKMDTDQQTHSWTAVEHQAHQMKNQYDQSMNALNAEITNLQAELRQRIAESSACKMHMADQEKMLEEFKYQLHYKQEETADAKHKDGITDSKLRELTHTIDELRLKVTSSTAQVSQISKEKEILESRIADMQRMNADMEQRECEAMMDVRESKQVVENAMLEKEQIQVLAAQKDEQIDHMQGSINKLINDAGIRTKNEVENVRKQCNESIERIMEELHAMEMDNTEKQAQIERALREKRAVESELESIYKEGMAQGAKDRGSYEDVNKRMISAERGKDDAEMKIESLQHDFKLKSANYEQERATLADETNAMKTRVKQLNTEFEAANDERIKLVSDLDAVKKKMQAAQHEKESTQRKCNKEICLLEQKHGVSLKELQAKLESTEDANRRGMMEQRKLLNGQQRMSAKWKEECQTVTQKMEGKVNEYKSEMEQNKKRCDELSSLLKEHQLKTGDAERQLSEYTQKIQRLELRVRDTEQRATQATKQLSRQVAKERSDMFQRTGVNRDMGSSRINRDIGMSRMGRDMDRSHINRDMDRSHINNRDLDRTHLSTSTRVNQPTDYRRTADQYMDNRDLNGDYSRMGNGYMSTAPASPGHRSVLEISALSER